MASQVIRPSTSLGPYLLFPLNVFGVPPSSPGIADWWQWEMAPFHCLHTRRKRLLASRHYLFMLSVSCPQPPCSYFWRHCMQPCDLTITHLRLNLRVFCCPAACWHRVSHEFAAKVPYMVVPGNHEAECHSPACLASPRRLNVRCLP